MKHLIIFCMILTACQSSPEDMGLKEAVKWLNKLEINNKTFKPYTVKALKDLKVLELVGTPVTDMDLVHLKALKNLKALDLSSTHVTDKGLVHLKALKGLTTLVLIGTRVTDEGLVHLKTLKNLTTLTLMGTQVTDAGVKDLKKALPKSNIIK
mgnify:CR=1 FL=1